MQKRSSGEGTITERSDGRFMARVSIGRDLNGKAIRKTVYGASRPEVVKKMVQIQSKVFTGVYYESSGMLLSQWVHSWYETYKKISLRPQTKELYEILIRTVIEPRIGGIKLKEICPMHIQGLVNRLHSDGYSTSTIQKIRNILSPAFRVAVSNKLIPDNPFKDIQMPPKREKTVRAFSRAEQEAFEMAAQRSGFYEAFILALDTGLRCGELLSLNWSDINLKSAEISVKKTLITVADEQTKKHVPIPQQMPKTQSSNRMIPLTPRSLNILKEMKKRRMNKDFNDNNIVFCSRAGTYVYPKNLRRSMAIVCNDAGIEDSGLHVLRHSFATRLFEENVQAKVVSELLGHSKIEVTLNTYTYVFNENKKDAIRLLSELKLAR